MTKTMTRVKNFRGAILLVIFGTSLAGCAASVPNPTFPELTFGHLGQINLNVASLEIVSSYKSPMAAPNVEHKFPSSPEKALMRWASDRLRATGSSARASFTILNASVRETTLEKQKGIKGAFTKDQSERYDAVLEASLKITDDDTNSEGFANAKASRSITVREDATLNERAQAWFELNEALMQDINAALEKNISQYLGNWLN